jgi:peptidoglycan/xylan/chitin deacetylase (PgdA/CDA1 family)
VRDGPTESGIAARRRSKRETLALAMRVTGLTQLLLRYGKWKGAIVLSYHRIGDGSSSEVNRSLWSVTQSQLDEQLRFLKRWFELIDPDQLREAVFGSQGRRVIVTFDDGYRDLYEQAHPVLQANGVHAAMFLCSGFIDRRATAWWDEIAWMLRHSRSQALAPGPWSPHTIPLGASTLERSIDQVTRSYWGCSPEETEPFLAALAAATGAGRRPRSTAEDEWITWEMAREMQSAGHRIGAHTFSHPILARLSRERQRREIEESMERIEAELGERPTLLAYPVGVRGAFNWETQAAAADAGIELAFSNYGGWLTPNTFSPLDVRRISAETLRRPGLFSSMLALPSVFGRVRER